MPTWPAMITSSSTCTLPAMPASAMMRQRAPIRTLCAIWTRLSIFVIGSGTKIDNLVHIAHNVRIGARCLIMALAGIAGSVQVEDDVIIAGQVGIADHLTIGRGARLLVQSGTIADIPAEGTYFGTLARPHREYLRGQLALYRLAKIVDDLERLVQPKAEAPPAVTER